MLSAELHGIDPGEGASMPPDVAVKLCSQSAMASVAGAIMLCGVASVAGAIMVCGAGILRANEEGSCIVSVDMEFRAVELES